MSLNICIYKTVVYRETIAQDLKDTCNTRDQKDESFGRQNRLTNLRLLL